MDQKRLELHKCWPSVETLTLTPDSRVARHTCLTISTDESNVCQKLSKLHADVLWNRRDYVSVTVHKWEQWGPEHSETHVQRANWVCNSNSATTTTTGCRTTTVLLNIFVQHDCRWIGGVLPRATDAALGCYIKNHKP